MDECVRNDAKQKELDHPKRAHYTVPFTQTFEWAVLLHGNENILHLLTWATGVTDRKHREPSEELNGSASWIAELSYWVIC